MASEDIGYLYPTKIPGYDDAADIQAALRLYHYGSATYDEANQNESTLEANSIAGNLRDLYAEITTLQDLGVGSVASSTEPSSPPDGFVWLNTSTSSTVATGAIAAYQNSAPTTNLVHGALWVDKDSSPLKMYVYDTSGTPGWREIGA